MNIFATYPCPIKSAIALDDKRVIKMAVESAQMLSTAIFVNHGNVENIYKPTHIKHPCTIWTSQNKENWNWLYKHFKALCDEYHFRFYKTHKSSDLIIPLLKSSICLPDGELEEFPNCARNTDMGLDFSNIKDVNIAYRKFLSAKWKLDKYPPKWTNRNKPDWE